MTKISTFIVGMIIASMVVAVLGVFLSAASYYYGIPDNSGNLTAYNRLTNLTQETKIIQNKMETVSEDATLFDIIGSYFSSGYETLRLAWNSFSIFSSMMDEAITHAQLGQSGSIIKMALLSSVIIMIVLGVIVSAMLKKDI